MLSFIRKQSFARLKRFPLHFQIDLDVGVGCFD
jgi:hypothetical protein